MLYILVPWLLLAERQPDVAVSLEPRSFHLLSRQDCFVDVCPPLIFLQFCCRCTRHRQVDSVKFKPEERSCRHSACCGCFFFFFTYLNSWTHHDNKQVNSVGHKIYCEAELKRKEGERMSCHGDVWNMTFVPEDIFRSDPFILQSI